MTGPGRSTQARLDAHDWDATPLGPPPSWPPRLRDAVQMVHAMPQPACVVWGGARVVLANDAYAALLGGTAPAPHAGAFDGLPAATVRTLSDALDAAFGGHAACIRALPSRPDATLDAYDFALTPLRADDGVVQGVLCTAFRTPMPVADAQACHRLFDVCDSGFGIGVLRRDAHGRAADLTWVQANARLDALLGAAHGGSAGHGIAELLPDASTRWLDALACAAASGEPVHFEDADAGGHWLDVTALAIAEDTVAVRVDDVGARRAAERRLREDEERNAYLLRLSDALRPLLDPHEACAAAAGLLGEMLGVDGVGYGEIDADDEHVAFHGAWAAPGAPALAGRFRMADFGASQVTALRMGTTLVIHDIAHHALLSPSERSNCSALGVAALVGVPLVKGGRLVAVLAVLARTPREWSAHERVLAEATAERTWAASVHARAETRLRESEARFRTLFTSLDEGCLLADVMFDAGGRAVDIAYVDANPAAVRMTGAQLAGRRLRDVDPAYEDYWYETFGRVARTGQPERRQQYTAVTDTWYDFYAFKLHPEDTDSRRIAVVFRDTTERTRQQARLQASEERQAFLVRFSDTVRDLDDAGRIPDEASRLLCTQLRASRVVFAEFEREEIVILGQHAAADLPPLPARHPLKALGRAALAAYGAGEPFVVADASRDPRISRSAVERLRAFGAASLLGLGLRGDNGIAGAVVAYADAPREWTAEETALVREAGERTWLAIKRARAESERAHSEQRLAAIFANAAVGLSEIDASGRFVQVNDELCRILGRPHEALVGRHVTDVTHPDDLSATVRTVARALEGGGAVSLDKRYLRPDGSTIWANSTVTAFRTAGAPAETLLIVTMDLSERKAAEAAREASEQLLRQFSDASSDVLWIRDAATLRWEYVSPAYGIVYGEPQEAALADNTLSHWTDRILDEDREHALACIQRVREGESVIFEYRIRRVSDGVLRWIRDTDFPIRDENGRVQRIGGIGHDVTDLKQAEAALAESEDLQRRLVQGIPQLVWRSDPRGDTTWMSPQWHDFTGQPRRDALCRRWMLAVHPDDAAAAEAAVQAASASGRMDAELRLRRADGTYVWHHLRSSPRRDADGRILEWLGTFTDVQQLKELQEQQQVLVAELQHRTRNLIAVVRSIAERISADSASLDEFRARFRDRMGALARVQGLLSQRDAGQRISFLQLLHAELAGLGVLDRVADGRIELAGPADVGLRSATVQTFALGIHELATNAIKYGALAAPHGRLAVRWWAEDDGRGPVLCVDWRESGVAVPPEALAAGARRGYGRELIERALPYQLQARTSYALGPDGVHCTIRVPLESGTRA